MAYVCPYFAHGLCLFPGACQYAHDDGTIAPERLNAIRLRDFVRIQGGVLASGHLGGFYSLYPEAKASFGNVKPICAKHPYLLRFVASKPVDLIESVPIAEGLKAWSGMAHAQPSEDFAPARWQTKEVAAALSQYVLEHGGRVDAGSAMDDYYRLHPEAKSIIGKLSSFCALHPELLEYVSVKDGGSKTGGSIVAKPAALKVGPAAASAEIVAAKRLGLFLAYNGGAMRTAAALPRFYLLYPDAKGVIGGRVREFCDRHSQFLRFVVKDGEGELVAASSGGRLDDALDAWERRLEAKESTISAREAELASREQALLALFRDTTLRAKQAAAALRSIPPSRLRAASRSVWEPAD